MKNITAKIYDTFDSLALPPSSAISANRVSHASLVSSPCFCTIKCGVTTPLSPDVNHQRNVSQSKTTAQERQEAQPNTDTEKSSD